MQKIILTILGVVFTVFSFGSVFSYDLTDTDKFIVFAVEKHIKKSYGNRKYKLPMIIAVFKMISNDDGKSERIREICKLLGGKIKTYQMGG